MTIQRIDRTAPQEQGRWRREVLGSLSGPVLAVGAGSGASADFLPAGVTWLALEPAPSRRLERAVAGRARSRLLTAGAERLPLEDATIDAVVCSTVLCSVDDPPRALAEARRVLRRGGSLVFFEHVGAAPGSGARRVQGLIAPLTRRFGGGCDPRRDTAAELRSAGFSTLELRTLRTGGPLGGLAPVIEGRAVV